ncbi:uncharacterized protein [Oryza sativa Japonica Group]|uniref:Os09g0416600 protein n=2 Tax=Oryza sativa subsp. japonica TaxID=39947 RepID=Q6EQ09_ORYSJ|nr:uncharacterized protein LOC9269387 [Oryza sativa Japonica Group]KAB8110539.1 hypothetical protein EE612_047845 [Oryza sativa]KAF2916191.1 hypothetical protein DAI22_09g099700 [Oryza sativa Japonica Group]BAD28921.1 unknown protein [Oryza sativa Japonica Group]BAD29261.1 unknown protein [Oryza sativa Japonica Group]BAG97722.1 unnamed protein product [Oryza sativa Japonica Group]
MPEGGIPACFRGAPGGGAGGGGGGGVGVAGQSSGGVGTSLATSVYETRLGVAALSWSRAALGLSLRVVLRVAGGAGAGAWAAASSSAASDYGCYDEGAECYGGEEEEEEEEATVAVRVRPWLLWRRRGSKRFRVRDRRVDLAWDLTRARFACPGSPEPSSGYFVAVVVDGEMALVAGDMAEEAYRKTKARRGPGPDAVLISRREHVSMRDAGHGRGHKTFVNVRGKEREISVDLVSRGHGKDRDKDKDKERDKADVGMSVTVDGERVLHIRRLRWKFRGTEKVDLGGGDGVQVSWDLHHWLFPNRDTAPADASAVTPPPQPAHAVFIFRFELADIAGDDRDSAEVKDEHLLENAGSGGGGGAWAGYLGRWGRGDWSESSSNGENRRKRGQARRLAKASSSSSASVASSSASWASGSTVMDWASPEEAELQRGHGFSLLVYAWKC